MSATQTSTFRKIFAGSALAVFAGIAVLGSFLFGQNSTQTENDLGGAGDSRASWVVFDRFDGYQTKADPQKITRGANPVGQNTYINDGDRISVRDFGYKFFPTTESRSSTSSPITSLHTFRKRDGTNILIRQHGGELEYYHPKIERFERLNYGYTTSTFGFADHNTNDDQTAYTYFGNGFENYSRWTGNVAELTTAVAVNDTSVTVDDTTGFPATGSIIFCGTRNTYTGRTATTLTGLSASTIACASGRGVAQQVQEFSAAPKGNILTVLNTRMFVAGVNSSTQTLFYSAIADASDFTFTSTTSHGANNGGLINMPEGGGGIVGMAVDEEVLYVFKRNIIKSVTFTQDAHDLPVVKPLKPHDNKSQTVGAISSKAIFASGNGIIFVTPNNEIMNIHRVPEVDYPQVLPISDIIKPTVDGMDFVSSTGVYWKNKAYISGRQSTDSPANDIILVYNTHRAAWESPIIGVNAGDLSIAKFTTEDLYFGSSNEPNVYKVTATPLDDIFGVTANWRSREETFGFPHLLKSMDNFYVEGYIADNTKLTISLLFDEDGFTQTYTTDFDGASSTPYLFLAQEYNVLGLHPFGFERFGSNPSFEGVKKFRVYLGKNLRRVPFYSTQVEFASDGENKQWEILQYGYHVLFEPQESRTSLYSAF